MEMKNWADIWKNITLLTQFGLSFITPLFICLGVCWWLSVHMGVGGWVYGRRLLARRRSAREALEAGEGDDNGKQGEAAAVSVIGFLIMLVCASVYMVSTLRKEDK